MYIIQSDVCFSQLLFCSYLAEQCWKGECIYFIMLRHVKQKAPPPPCNVIGTISVPVSNGEEKHNRAQTENCSTDVPHSSFPCNLESKDSELQSHPNLYNSSYSLDSCETSGSTLSTHTLTKQNLDPGSAVPACLRHSHPLDFQMNSFICETSNQVCHIATLWFKRPLLLINLNSHTFILKIRNNKMKRD